MGGRGSLVTSPSEFPRLPSEVVASTQQLSMNGLVFECVNLAKRDKDFTGMKIIQSGLGFKRILHNRTEIEVDFTAQHCFDDGMYDGDAYNLELRVAQTVPYATNDVINLAEEGGFQLPNDEQIINVRFAHVAEYIVSQAATLGWNIHQYFEINFHDDDSSSDVVGSDYESDDDGSADDEQEESTLSSLYLPFDTEHHQAPDMKFILENTSSESNDEIIEKLELEIYLRQALEVIGMIKSRNRRLPDLSMILPREYMDGYGK